jgi:two-component system, cell cycle sensor histidine kinase and response regulator CckA
MHPEATHVIERPAKAVVPSWLEWKGSGGVLVVDDDEAVRLVLMRSLTKIGFTVTVAADGPEAVAHMEADPSRYRLVLLDFKLPGMDSSVVFHEIRSRRVDLPVILMSGYCREDAADRSSGMDFADFLNKPFTIDVLASKVRHALGA